MMKQESDIVDLYLNVMKDLSIPCTMMKQESDIVDLYWRLKQKYENAARMPDSEYRTLMMTTLWGQAEILTTVLGYRPKRDK